MDFSEELLADPVGGSGGGNPLAFTHSEWVGVSNNHGGRGEGVLSDMI